MLRRPIFARLIFRPILCLIVPVALTACAGIPGPDYEAFEFAAMRPASIMPKSSPTQMVSAFDRYCWEGRRAPAALPERLRDDSYVAARRAPGQALTRFVADGTRPMVMLSDTPRYHCVIAGTPRSGQTRRILDHMASRYPQAVAIPPRQTDLPAEQVWQLPGAGSGFVYLARPYWFATRSTLAMGLVLDR